MGLPCRLTVNTADESGGPATLYLNDGGTAAYDASASNPSAGKLVFAYTVEVGDQTPDLAITQVHLPGPIFPDSHGNKPDFSGALDVNLGVQVAPSLVANTRILTGTLWLYYGQTYSAAYQLDSTGHMIGLGTVTQPVANSGTIEAYGGLLTLTGGASGSGTMQVDRGSKLQLSQQTKAGTIIDNGTLQLVGYAVTAPMITVGAGASVFGNGQIYGEVSNAGTIESHGGRLLIDGGVTGTGTLLTEAGTTLELEGNAAAGSLIDNGLLLIDGGTINITASMVAAGESIAGFGSFLGPVADAGLITARGGLLKLGAVTGGGSLQIANGATLELTQAALLDVGFAAGGIGSLALDAEASFTGIIQGLTVGQSLIFNTETVQSGMIDGSTLTVMGSAGDMTYQLAGPHGAAMSVINGHTLTVTA